MFERVIRFYTEPIYRLSRRLVLLILGFVILAQILLLVPALPGFHQSEIQNRMRELAFMAELRLVEEKYAQQKTPIPEGCGVGLLNAKGNKIWFGSQNTINAAQEITPLQWQDNWLSQFPLALSALFATDSKPQVYRLNTSKITQSGVHARLRKDFEIDVILPADIASSALRLQVVKSIALVFFFGLLIGLPFAYVFNRKVIEPLEGLVEDMTDFANDPYQPRSGMIYHDDDSIITDAQQALHILQTATRRELVQREKLASMGEAVAKVNHDMRNVLSSAMLVSDSLEDSDDPKVKKSAKIVNKAIERAATLCGQMLTFIKSPENIKPKQSSMRAIIDECAEEMGIKIDYSGPEELMVDSSYFFRLIHNLVNNAAKAGADQISITIWKAGSYAVMDVADNGPGMDDKTKALLFKPFKGSTKGSSGLGLCISRDIAVAHGGDLRLTRSNQNGSEFRLRLPVEVLGDIKSNRFWDDAAARS